ncbi:MAG: pre-peptidase C-terminal domain-containing protein [Deltaproteobacteria bacterium]|nr:pre-peptidase C-terminal domain-containing protein [Deltaproteobacteria bacterium]
MKRNLIYMLMVLMAPMFGGAELSVVSAVDGIPTFVKGDLGSVEPLATTTLGTIGNEAAIRSSVTRFAHALALKAFDATGTEELVTTRVKSDALGTMHVRLDQYLGGIKVEGADLVVHANASSGRVYAVNGNFVPAHRAADGRQVEKLDVAARLQSGGIPGAVIETPVLAYLLSQEKDYAHLTWKVRVEHTAKNGDYSNDFLFFDAADGKLLDRHATVHTAKSWTTYSANNGTSLPGTQLCAGNQSCGGDNAAQDAHDNSSITYDYYLAKFGRDSLNGSGFALRSTVHYQNNYNNAFWNGSQMVYGDGDGTTFSPLSGSLDVVAHELTHGVTEFESNLIYARESGGINEALSDIFGAAAEAWSDGAISASTWLLGEDIYTPNGPSNDALRYINNPTADGYSKDYYPERLYPGSCTPSNSNDQCGVHGNSGIANMAFYLMVQGGTHPRGVTSNSVPALGMSKAEQIFYRAQTSYLTSSSDFSALRTATAQAAQDLYGASDASAVHDAWCAVGVPGCPSGGGSSALENGVAETGLSGATGSETFYTVEIPAGATNLTIVTSGGSGDADLHVRFGTAPTTSTYDCRPYESGNNETCTFAAPSTGTYHVMLRGYSAYSGVSLVANWTEPSGGGGGELENGVAETGLSGATGSDTFYTIEVPAGATNLTVTLSGGSGDADLYVRSGSQPTTSTYDCRSWASGNGESCSFATPSAGTYHVLVHAYAAYSGASLVASFTPPVAGCSSSGSVSNISGATGSEARYTWEVPACASSVTVEISGGTGDADLYVRFGSQPTTSTYDCRPYETGNNETCTFNTPGTGTYHLMVRAYAAISGVTLDASYE